MSVQGLFIIRKRLTDLKSSSQCAFIKQEFINKIFIYINLCGLSVNCAAVGWVRICFFAGQ